MIISFKENRVRRAYYGGKRIDAFKGKEKCEDGRQPEEWLASVVTAFNPDKPIENEGLSICQNGRLFRDVLKENKEEFLGKGIEEMAILVKLLDSSERLVIQCHPTVSFAKKNFNSDFGKTECWYMLECSEDACIYLGFKPGITKEKWIELFNNQDIEGMLECLHKFNVKSGELWFVDGGIPHAIGAGCFMIELQEPSDLMVIPEKITPSGIILNEQKLHCGLGFEGMFDCFEYESLTKEQLMDKYYRKPTEKANEINEIVDDTLTDKFNMKLLSVNGEYEYFSKGIYQLAIVINGKCVIFDEQSEHQFEKGDIFFIAASTDMLSIKGDANIVLCSEN